MHKIEAVIFDYGKVLSLPPTDADIEAMSEILELEPVHFNQLWHKHRLFYDNGQLDAASYWTIVAKEAGRKMTPEQMKKIITIDYLSWTKPNQITINWVSQLKRLGLRTAILSNMPSDHRQYILDNCKWLPKFDHHTFSGDIGSVKPEAKIYQHCLDGLDIKPSQAVFLDDKEENVRGAEKLGLHAIVFESAEQAATDLSRRFGLSLPHAI